MFRRLKDSPQSLFLCNNLELCHLSGQKRKNLAMAKPYALITGQVFPPLLDFRLFLNLQIDAGKGE